MKKISCWYEKLNYSIESDTIFIIEKISVDNSSWNTTIYSSADTLQYYRTGIKEIKYRKDHILNYNQLDLIRAWNVEELQRLGKDSEYSSFSPSMVYVARIIFRKGRYKIDCVKFLNFHSE